VLNIASIIKLFLTLASSLAQYAHDKKMMQAGAAMAVVEGLKDVQEKMAIARDAIADVDSLPISQDPNNRANKR
jgi:hypothetical protein